MGQCVTHPKRETSNKCLKHNFHGGIHLGAVAAVFEHGTVPGHNEQTQGNRQLAAVPGKGWLCQVQLLKISSLCPAAH